MATLPKIFTTSPLQKAVEKATQKSVSLTEAAKVVKPTQSSFSSAPKQSQQVVLGNSNIFISSSLSQAVGNVQSNNQGMSIDLSKSISSQSTKKTVSDTPSAKIVNVSPSLIAGDELSVSVTVQNTSSGTIEVRCYLYGAGGELVDKEPDTYWKNINAGGTAVFVISSNWKNFDIGNFAGAYRVAAVGQGGLIFDERAGSLTNNTKETYKVEDRIGTTTNPNTAPALGNTISDAYKEETKEKTTSRLGLAGLALIGIAAYFLLKK